MQAWEAGSHPPGAGAFCLQSGFVDECSLQDAVTEMTGFYESVTVSHIPLPFVLRLGVCYRSSELLKWVTLVLYQLLVRYSLVCMY